MPPYHLANLEAGVFSAAAGSSIGVTEHTEACNLVRGGVLLNPQSSPSKTDASYMQAPREAVPPPPGAMSINHVHLSVQIKLFAYDHG